MLVRGLFARSAGRASASDQDWCPVHDGAGHCRDIPEGTLLLRPIEDVDRWVVVCCLSDTAARPIAHGSRSEVEQDTREFVLFGLPGGAEPSGRPWRFGEGSLHHAAGDGSFRLMLQHGEHGGLVFVRHDAAVFFLGEDRIDALTCSAEARLDHVGQPLHAWFAGRRLPLRGVGVVGVVGQAEVARDVRIVLVHVDHDRFELHVATTGEAFGLLGVYTGADLRRGDLGELFTGRVQRSPSPPAHHVPSSEPKRPPDEPPQRTELARPQTKPRRGSPPPADKPPPPPPATFTAEDRQRLDACLTPRRRDYIGAGASMMVHLYDGFRLLTGDVLGDLAEALRQYGEPLRAKRIREIIEKKRKAPLPGCDRTFTRGLVRFLAETGLGERIGRRFRLHLANWPLIISMLRASYPITVPTPSPAATPPEPVVASRSSMPSSDVSASAPPTTSLPPPSTSMREPVGDLPRPGDHGPGHVELVDGGWPPMIREDGRPMYYQRLYDRTDEDSPSRFKGVNPNRGPPKS